MIPLLAEIDLIFAKIIQLHIDHMVDSESLIDDQTHKVLINGKLELQKASCLFQIKMTKS